jgi:hypothetical protein
MAEMKNPLLEKAKQDPVNISFPHPEPNFHWAEGTICIRKGNCNVLVVAPHGHQSNDEGTYHLARRLADLLDCYALINRKFKKPPQRRNPETARILRNRNGAVRKYNSHKGRKWVDLNRINQVEKHLKTEFLVPFKSSVEEIIEKYKHAIVLWIHGLNDTSAVSEQKKMELAEQVHVLIGYGQGHPARPTSDFNTIEIFRNQLKTEKINAFPARAESNYCGRWKNNMNQWFRNNGYTIDEIESIQLEIGYTGFRDSTDNIEKFSQRLNRVTRSLPDFKMRNADMEEVYANLTHLFSKGLEMTMLEAGRYLIDTFFGGSIERARSNNKSEVLRPLSKFIDRVTNQNQHAPKKTWIYNYEKMLKSIETAMAKSKEAQKNKT